MSLYPLFADVLNYPAPGLSERVSDCVSELATDLPNAEELLRRFQRAHVELGTARLQEIYTSTFDMQPECTPNLSYHLFGEDQRRGMFLAKLTELFQQARVDTANELPDHLCCLLLYLATGPGAAATTDLITDCLLPTVSKIARGVDEASNPYRTVLDALLLFLEKERGDAATSGETSSRGSETIARQG